MVGKSEKSEIMLLTDANVLKNENSASARAFSETGNGASTGKYCAQYNIPDPHPTSPENKIDCHPRVSNLTVVNTPMAMIRMIHPSHNCMRYLLVMVILAPVKIMVGPSVQLMARKQTPLRIEEAPLTDCQYVAK